MQAHPATDLNSDQQTHFMKYFLTTLVTLLILATRGLSADPNFIFILVDDQGWSGTSVAMLPGNDASRTASFCMPNVDRLAARGVIFSQAMWTVPSASARVRPC